MSFIKTIFATLVMILSTNAFALNLEYPELQVVPSAEDRLKDAVKAEKEGNFFMRNWQVTVPSAALIFSGMTLSGNKDIDASLSGTRLDEVEKEVSSAAFLQIAAGLSWMGMAYYFEKDSEYQNAFSKLTKMPKGKKRQRLYRARLAEEALHKRYRMMKKLKWLIAGTTLALPLMENSNGNETARMVAGVTALTAGIPLFFNHSYETNYLNYEKYKNRIYGPVVDARFVLSADQRTLVPGVGFSLHF